MSGVRPFVLLLASALGVSAVQLALASQPFSVFSVLGMSPDVALMTAIYAVAGVALLIGYGAGSPVWAAAPVRVYREMNMEAMMQDARWLLGINFIIICVSQYYMGHANVLAIIRGDVSAQEIEGVLASSPLGVHGIKLLCGYYTVIFHRAWSRATGPSLLRYALLIEAIFIFLSSGKAGGMLFLLASLLTLNPRGGFPWVKAVVAAGSIAVIFLATRLARNPYLRLDDVWGFLLVFAFGFYLGSPLVNTSYVAAHPDQGGSAVFLFSHLLPHKLLPVTLKELSAALPDPTSPLGLIGSAYAAGGLWSLIPACLFVGWLTRRLEPKDDRGYRFLFMPFLLVACAFSVMYHHFFNLTFFWVPLLMSLYAARRYRF